MPAEAGIQCVSVTVDSRFRGNDGSGGFTLLEILVVVVIIGILAGFAVLSIGSRALDDRMYAEARRLRELLELAAEESVVRGVDIGLHLAPEAYGFYAVDDTGKWAAYAETGPLRNREIEQPFTLTLFTDGREQPPPRDGDIQPQVLLLSSGELTPFAVDIGVRDYPAYYHIEADLLGRMKMERLEEKR